MTAFLKSARVIGAAGAALALASAPAMAADATPSTPQPAAKAAVDSNAVTVVRDSATGELRAPTALEALVLENAGARNASGRLNTLARLHANGARGARLSNEMMNHVVLVRQPDGRLVEQCFDSRAEAEAAVRAGQIATQAALPTE